VNTTTTTTGSDSAPAQNADGTQNPGQNAADSGNQKESSSKKKKGLRKIVPW
jgi:hypothetical protein